MRWFLLLFCFLLLGCEKEPLQFFPQDHYYEDPNEPEDYNFRSDIIVMVSPPETNLEIIEAVDKYIAEHYSPNEINRYKKFIIVFFRESSVTKRVYQDWDQYLAFKQGLIAQTPRFNPEDQILLVKWFQGGILYSFYNEYDAKCPNGLIIRNNGERKYRGGCPKFENKRPPKLLSESTF